MYLLHEEMVYVEWPGTHTSNIGDIEGYPPMCWTPMKPARGTQYGRFIAMAGIIVDGGWILVCIFLSCKPAIKLALLAHDLVHSCAGHNTYFDAAKKPYRLKSFTKAW